MGLAFLAAGALAAGLGASMLFEESGADTAHCPACGGSGEVCREHVGPIVDALSTDSATVALRGYPDPQQFPQVRPEPKPEEIRRDP